MIKTREEVARQTKTYHLISVANPLRDIHYSHLDTGFSPLVRLSCLYTPCKAEDDCWCAQMLGSIWYEGVPGFRRCHILQQSLLISRLCVLYPYYCLMYMLAPHTNTGHICVLEIQTNPTKFHNAQRRPLLISHLLV